MHGSSRSDGETLNEIRYRQQARSMPRQARMPSFPMGARGHRSGCRCTACQGLQGQQYADPWMPVAPATQASEFVRWVQSALGRTLASRLPITGVMDTRTRQAVRQFQRLERLPEDGIVGPPTQRILEQMSTGRLVQTELADLESEVTSNSVPRLVGVEQSPLGKTLYLEIDLGIRVSNSTFAKPITGVFIPSGLRSDRLNIILYLHGIKTRPDLSIKEYWSSQFPHFALREGLARSGQQAILVAPTLGPRSQREVGNLIKAGGLDQYLQQVMSGLSAYANLTSPLMNLVLACHSGGGWPMRKIAMAANQSRGLIRECWGFDCTYFNDDIEWLKWAQKSPKSRLFLYYLQNSPTQRHILPLINQRANLIVLKADTSLLRRKYPKTIAHNLVPLSHWQERLSSANFL
jgi:hypothetical protein